MYAEEMVQQSRPGAFIRTYMAVQKHLTPVSGDPMPLLLTSEDTRHAGGTHTYMEEKRP